jgi:hypothetical protein
MKKKKPNKQTKKKKKEKREKLKQNTTNFIFINRSGMGEVSIVSIPDLGLLFTFISMKNDGGVTEYNFT